MGGAVGRVSLASIPKMSSSTTDPRTVLKIRSSNDHIKWAGTGSLELETILVDPYRL